MWRKSLWTRFTCFLLSLILMITFPVPDLSPVTSAEEADSPVQNKYVNTQILGETGNLRDYLPERDGYFALCRVDYEVPPKNKNSIERFSKQCLVPVLTGGGELFVACDQLNKVTNLLIERNGDKLEISFESRHLSLTAGDEKYLFQTGEGSSILSKTTCTLPAPFVLQDQIYVPFIEVCTVMGIALHLGEMDGQLCLMIDLAKRDVFDILAELKQSVTDGRVTLYQTDPVIDQALYMESQWVKFADGMLPSGVSITDLILMGLADVSDKFGETFGDQNYEDIIQSILTCDEDEQVELTSSAYGILRDVLSTFWEAGHNADSEKVITHFAAEWKKIAKVAVKDNFNAVDSLAVQDHFLRRNMALDQLKTAGFAMDVIGSAGDYLLTAFDCISLYMNRDLLSMKGLKVFLDLVDDDALIGKAGITELQEELHNYELNGTQFVLTEEMTGQLSDLASNAVSTMVSLSSLATAAITASYSVLRMYADKYVEAPEDYQRMVYCIWLQKDAGKVLSSLLSKIDQGRKISGPQLRTLMEAAYFYLECTMQTDQYFRSAFSFSKDNRLLTAVNNLEEEACRDAAVLTAWYIEDKDGSGSADVLLPMQGFDRISSASDFPPFDDCLIPLYRKISGTVTDVATGNPVEDAVCEISDDPGFDTGLIGRFEGTPGGMYEEVSFPKTYAWTFHDSWKLEKPKMIYLRFTSPAVKGEDRIGIAVYPSDRAEEAIDVMKAQLGGSLLVEPVASKTEVPAGYTGIYTAEDLKRIRDIPAGKYILMEDIAVGTWEPDSPSEGDDTEPDMEDEPVQSVFTGEFDGNGHILTEVNIMYALNGSAGLTGLFGIVQGSVHDLVVSGEYNIRLIGAESGTAGGIAGVVREGGSIDNCTSLVNLYMYSDGMPDAPGIYAAGGIAGRIGDGAPQITRCQNLGVIENRTDCGGDNAAGGIAGFVGTSAAANVEGCRNCGETYCVDYAGGIIGEILLENGGSCSVTRCVNEGQAEGFYGSGGIVGIAATDNFWEENGDVSTATVLVEDCLNSGEIKITKMPRKGTDVTDYSVKEIGGVAGMMLSGTIKRCINIGEVTPDEGENSCAIAGLVWNDVSMEGCVWSVTCSAEYGGVYQSGGLKTGVLYTTEKLPEEDLLNPQVLTGYDQDTVWNFDTGRTVPYPHVFDRALVFSGGDGGITLVSAFLDS